MQGRLFLLQRAALTAGGGGCIMAAENEILRNRGDGMLAFLLNALESPGERRQFAALYEQYHDRMERIALHMLGNPHDAEDAVQNAFCQIIRHFDKLDEIPCEKRVFWIISIVQNEARMILRKRRRTVPLEDWDGPEEADVSNYQELVELFRHLPETYRAVMEMKFLLDCSDREIARRLGISETAVSTRVNRGRALLKKILEKEGEVL